MVHDMYWQMLGREQGDEAIKDHDPLPDGKAYVELDDEAKTRIWHPYWPGDVKNTVNKQFIDAIAAHVHEVEKVPT